MVDNTVWKDIELVCKRIPPLWDLPNYVAVNPFLGFAGRPLPEAAATIHDELGAAVLPSVDYYCTQWSKGVFSRMDLTDAARRFGEDPALLENVLDGKKTIQTRAVERILTFAEQHDAQCGTSWERLLVTGAARWCAAQAGQGGAFQFASGENDLYSKWREAAEVDRSPEIAGLVGWREWVRSLPICAEEAICAMLERLEVLPAGRPAYLYRLLRGVYGWASFFRRSSWGNEHNELGPLLDLLAIRICCDAAVPTPVKGCGPASAAFSLQMTEDENTRLIFQEALEDGIAKTLLAKIAGASRIMPLPARPIVQAVFCIDTRSELLRRHLEAVSPSVQTLGFAGFFGVSLSWQEDGENSARCPVLLSPSVQAGPKNPVRQVGKQSLEIRSERPLGSLHVRRIARCRLWAGAGRRCGGFRPAKRFAGERCAFPLSGGCRGRKPSFARPYRSCNEYPQKSGTANRFCPFDLVLRA